jgi:hypothetical protein
VILNRIMSGAAAVGAVAACAGVAVIAAAFALYALVREWLGEPAAAAVVALVFAIIAGAVTLVARRGVQGGAHRPRRGEPEREPDPIERLIDLAKERPLIAAGAAAVAGMMALRNPLIVSTLISTLLKPRRPRP